MGELQLGRQAPPLTLWRIDGYEESGSSAGAMTVLVLTTGDVSDADRAVEDVTTGMGSWNAITSIRLVVSADDLAV
jgi:hypothetical protein